MKTERNINKHIYIYIHTYIYIYIYSQIFVFLKSSSKKGLAVLFSSHSTNHLGNQLKGEFTKCSVGLELPSGHALRSSLDEAKEFVEALMDELLGINIFKPFQNRPTKKKQVIPPRLKDVSDDDLSSFEATCTEEVSWPYIYPQNLSDMHMNYILEFRNQTCEMICNLNPSKNHLISQAGLRYARSEC